VTLVGIGVANAILAWLTVVVALVGALAAVALLGRVVRPALEIERYSRDILASGVAIAGNLDGVDELERTGEAAAAVPGLALAFLARAEGDR
jgi:hypothetical protein